MSYSSDAKKDMLSVEINRKCCLFSFIYGIISFSARIKQEDDTKALVFLTENSELADKVISSLNSLFKINGKKDIIHKKHSKYDTYCVTVDKPSDLGKLIKVMKLNVSEDGGCEFNVDSAIVDKPCCKKSFIRGAFLSGGSLIHPEKKYHLEFVTCHRQVSEDFCGIMQNMGLNPKTIIRKKNYVIYFKNSEEIADILNITGVFNTLMDFHNIRIMKDVRNNTNRIINCETANTDKIMAASISQILCIEKLKNSNKWENLSPVLKEIAELRLEHKNSSLKELGEMFTPKLSRSGVNHRLKRLEDIAKSLDSDE